MPELTSRLACRACGREAADPALPLACPAAGSDGADHVLRRELGGAAPARRDAAAALRRHHPRPFVGYRGLFHAYLAARRRGLADAEYLALVERLEAALARRHGRGLEATPSREVPALAGELGIRSLWVKDETTNLAGSHKIRHLAGVLLALELAERLRGERRIARPLAISSCGNAALAAAALADATGRRLEVFVPAAAPGSILERLAALGARIRPCARRDRSGDPCYLAFRQAVAAGALPFSCQGPDNALSIEGGSTLAWELSAAIAERGGAPDRIFVQVGGGALASAVMRGLREAHELGALPRLPALHAVQTVRLHPLARAWDRLVARLLGDDYGEAPAAAARAERAAAVTAGGEARWRQGLADAIQDRSEFMRPWPGGAVSAADAILDDETYDWAAVVEGMLATGGWPVLVSEDELLAARECGGELADAPVSATGTAGLAACRQLAEGGLLAPSETVAVLFTGREQ